MRHELKVCERRGHQLPHACAACTRIGSCAIATIEERKRLPNRRHYRLLGGKRRRCSHKVLLALPPGNRFLAEHLFPCLYSSQRRVLRGVRVHVRDPIPPLD